MEIAEHPQIPDLWAIKREERRAVPPYMSARRRKAEKFSDVISVIPEFGVDLVSFLHHIENVIGVLPQCPVHKINVARKLLVTLARSQGSRER
jgi:hypothetical protein